MIKMHHSRPVDRAAKPFRALEDIMQEEQAAAAAEMLARGHQVKLIYPENGTPRLTNQLLSHSNLTVEHYASRAVPLDELAVRLSAKVANRQPGLEGAKASFGAQNHSKIILEDAALHKRIKDFEPDLLLADAVLAGGSALADKLGIPKAVMVPFFGSGMMNRLFGSGASLLATVPQFSSSLPRHMNLLQRLQNLAVHVVNDIVFTLVLEAHLNKVIWRNYNIPPYGMSKSYQQAALVLAGSEWAVSCAQPLSPHIVMFGAITAKSPQPLPPHLESFVRSAGEHGVVLASLGSTAIPEVPELKAIAKALSGIAPTKVVWKLAKQDLELVGGNSSDLHLGDNILLSDWVPQNDLLGHPNIKAFFTQGGTNSFNEAAYHGVPIVGMPLFGEQPDTVAQAGHQGFGLAVSVHKLRTLAADLEHALKRILAEPSFATEAARVSRLMHSRRRLPAESAADALEHAAWTRGDKYLQPLRHDLNAFQMGSWDVILIALTLVLAVVTLALCLAYYVARFGIRLAARVCRRRPIAKHNKAL
ncbi:hypothetical protein WJX77_000384 [Trebouxia sp. C0004]